MRLFLVFLLVPIIEIALFIRVGGWIGLWPTLALVVLTALAGTFLVRQQGLGTLARLQANLAEGGNPLPDLAHGAMILVAGLLLLTPGFFTDTFGLLLLLPPVRERVIAALASRVTVMHRGGQSAGARPRDDSAPIDAEYEVIDEDEDGPAPRSGDGKPSGWTARR